MTVYSETEYVIYCSHCGRTDSIRTGDSDYRWNDTPSRYFHREGWRTGEKGSGDNVCPYCVRSEKGAGTGARFK